MTQKSASLKKNLQIEKLQKELNLQKVLTNHDNYITTPEFNTVAASVFNARLLQPNLITKTDFDVNCQS